MKFAVSSWRPWTQQDKDKLENVQRKAVRIIWGLQGSTYEEKLEELGLQTQEARRERSAKNINVFKNKYDHYIRSAMITGIYWHT